jgi:protein tyrosine phosphatase (PTP) superfamily phosphohydrolase (DUF442 family)
MDISKITEYLSLSSKVTKKNVDEVLELDPRLVISMIVQRKPPEALEQPPRTVLWLRTFDFPFLPIPVRTLYRGVEAALPVIQDGNWVLVFCEGGRRRSVAMASCILIGKGYSADDAMGLIKERRDVADPYANHIQRQIRKFETYWHKNHPAA